MIPQMIHFFLGSNIWEIFGDLRKMAGTGGQKPTLSTTKQHLCLWGSCGSPTESLQVARPQAAVLQAERGERGGVGETGGERHEAAGVHFLCELRVTGEVQHTEAGGSRHHPC